MPDEADEAKEQADFDTPLAAIQSQVKGWDRTALQADSCALKTLQSLRTLPPGPYPIGAIACVLLFSVGVAVCAEAVGPFATIFRPLLLLFDGLTFMEDVAAAKLFFTIALPVCLVFTLLVVHRAMHARDIFVGRPDIAYRTTTLVLYLLKKGEVEKQDAAAAKVQATMRGKKARAEVQAIKAARESTPPLSGFLDWLKGLFVRRCAPPRLTPAPPRHLPHLSHSSHATSHATAPSAIPTHHPPV